jgi:hypothetical protein
MLEQSGEFTLQSLEELEGQNCTGHKGTAGSNTAKQAICPYVKFTVAVCSTRSLSEETKNDHKKV